MKEIIRFQKDRQLDKQPYDYNNECVNIVEELLEIGGFKVPKQNRERLVHFWDYFVHTALNFGISVKDEEFDPEYSPIDGFNDIKTFCVGAEMKLGFDPEIAWDECAKEINSRVGMIVDGKFQKYISDEAKAKWYTADYSKAKTK